MRLLAIETSTTLGGVAIIEGDALISECRTNVSVTHSERLMATIQYLLAASRLSIDDIDVFGIAIGPGSFTGLRVGLSTVKGLVYATQRKLTACSTLEAFAWSAHHSAYQVCPMLDARKKEVYAGLFKWRGDDFLRTMDEQALKVADLVRGIEEPTLFLGEGAHIYRSTLQDALGGLALFAPPQSMVPSPSHTAYLCMRKAAQGEFQDPITLIPKYLRKSEAEIRLQK